jgi:CheY-like chemotaxis protein
MIEAKVNERGKPNMAHILIVEDEHLMRFLIRKVLESAGKTVEEAGDGLEALTALDQSDHPVDLILLDIQMPRMNGFEFLSVLKRRHPYPPVISLTAHWNKIPADLNPALSGHLTKPFSRKKLLDAVHSALHTPPPLN